MQKCTVVWRFCLAAFAAWLSPVSLHATPTIEIQTYNLQPNTPGQLIQIFAHGGDHVQGLDFTIQTGDGGPFVKGGTVGGAAPTMTSINTQPTASSIFTTSNSNTPSGGPVTDPTTNPPNPNVSQLWEIQFTTTVAFATVGTGDSVATHQLLANVIIDTTGYFSGSFPLTLIGTQGGDTDFTNVGITNNSPNPGNPSILQIVPEPSSFALMLLGAPLLLLRRRAVTVS